MKRISQKLSMLIVAVLLLSLAAGCTVASVTTTTAGGAAAPAEGGAEAPAEGGAEAPAEGGAEAPAEGGEAPAEGGAEAPAEGGAEAPAEGGGDGKAVVEKICTQCHGLTDITGPGLGAVAGKEFMKGQFMAPTARPDWTDTVKRMKDVNGCPMTDEEATAVVEWLNANAK